MTRSDPPETGPGAPPPGEARQKLERLEHLLAPVRSALLAFSGGVDSTFLLSVLRKDPGRRILAVTAVSPAQPREEQAEARRLAARFGVEHREIRTGELRLEAFRTNPPDRCLHCKRHLFGKMEEIRKAEGFEVLMDGSNADDLSDHRPGIRALRELAVRSPLQEAGLTKAEIRSLSRWLGLETWNRPSMACLASRIPYGTEITKEALERIDRCEAFLRESVQGPVRVRSHGNTARIEVTPQAIPGLVARREALVRFFKDQGFTYVAVDLEGYRTGSMNEAT